MGIINNLNLNEIHSLLLPLKHATCDILKKKCSFLLDSYIKTQDEMKETSIIQSSLVTFRDILPNEKIFQEEGPKANTKHSESGQAGRERVLLHAYQWYCHH